MPDNASYYHAAYGIAIAVYAVYAVTLLRRRARVRDALARESRAASPSD
jgi:hypothetical protein